MTTPEVRADRRRRNRFSAWFAVAVAVFYGVAKTFADGFDYAYFLAALYAVLWLQTEYELEREAQP